VDVAVAGSSGLIGTALVRALEGAGARVHRLVRPGSPHGSNGVAWDPAAGSIDAPALEGVGAVVNLAGKPVGPHRWTAAHKAEVLESRMRSTRLLAETVAALEQPPEVLVSASASGYYGDRGEEILTEESPPGTGFLSDVCLQWEAATEPASQAGIRVAHIRTGIVLSAEGGALSRMLPLFRMGLGGRIGSGAQWWSWISIEDEVAAIAHLIGATEAAGAFNLTSPHPVTNAELTSVLARVLGRPAALPVPKFALRAAFGEFADEGLLSSQRILPRRLEHAGYSFREPELEPALRGLLAS
jgi:uncharacterized protein (TIGR01777 family)